MQSSDRAHPAQAPGELVEPEPYPAVQALRKHAEAAALVAGVGVFLFVLRAARRRNVWAVFQALFLGALVAIGVKDLAELNDLVADSLLPQ